MFSTLAKIRPSKQATSLASIKSAQTGPALEGFSFDSKIPRRIEDNDPFESAPPKMPSIPRTPIKLSEPVTASGAPLYDPTLSSKLLQGSEAQTRHAEHLASPQIANIAAGRPVQSSMAYGAPGATEAFQKSAPPSTTPHPLTAPFFPAIAADWFAAHEGSPAFTRALVGVAREKTLPTREGAPEYEPESMRDTLAKWHQANPPETPLGGVSPFEAPTPSYVDNVMRQLQAAELQKIRTPGRTATNVPTPEETKHIYSGPTPPDMLDRDVDSNDLLTIIEHDAAAQAKKMHSGLVGPPRSEAQVRASARDAWAEERKKNDVINRQAFRDRLLQHIPEADREAQWQELSGDPEQLAPLFFNRHNTPRLDTLARGVRTPLETWRASPLYPAHLRAIKQGVDLTTLDRTAAKLQEVIAEDQTEKAPTTARPEDKKHREALVAEASRRHFQDQPFGTAAMVGGGVGVGMPLLLAAIANPSLYARDPGRLLQMAAAGGVVGTGAGMGAEAIGRLLTRNFGPQFRTSQWHRDQDPNRWNTALRAAPMAVAALAGRTLPTMYNSIKGASNDQDLRKRIAEACRQTTLPNLKEIEHGQYQKGHFSWKGLRITIESAPGAVRRGVDKDGTEWSVTLKNAYGYIRGTTSAEPGDQMDIFMGPHPESEIVFVVDQNKQKSKVFDEHKVVAGVRTAQEAKDLYLANYSKSWTGFRAVTALTLGQFKSWLKNGDMTKPLAGQQFKDFYKQAGLHELIARIAGAAQRHPNATMAAWAIPGLAGSGALAVHSWRSNQKLIAEAMQRHNEQVAEDKQWYQDHPEFVSFEDHLKRVKEEHKNRIATPAKDSGTSGAYRNLIPVGLGAVAGGAAGHAAGLLVRGSDSEKDISWARRHAPALMALAGAAGGGYLGHHINKQARMRTTFY